MTSSLFGIHTMLIFFSTRHPEHEQDLYDSVHLILFRECCVKLVPSLSYTLCAFDGPLSPRDPIGTILLLQSFKQHNQLLLFVVFFVLSNSL